MPPLAGQSNTGILSAQQPQYFHQYGFGAPPIQAPDTAHAAYGQRYQQWQQQQQRPPVYGGNTAGGYHGQAAPSQMYGGASPHAPLLDPTSLMSVQERAFYAGMAAGCAACWSVCMLLYVSLCVPITITMYTICSKVSTKVKH
jgi:hypothetical protein